MWIPPPEELLFCYWPLNKIAAKYGDDDIDQGDSDFDDDEDDDVCEQMSRGSEGVHSLAPIALFLLLLASLPGPYSAWPL